MQKLLVNPDPKYYMSRGQQCWAASDNAHGGECFQGYVDGKTRVDDKEAYVFRYMPPDSPGLELTEKVPAENLFPDLASVEAARRNDRSVQEKAVRDACGTVKSLAGFLLSRADLCAMEREIVLERMVALGLSDAHTRKEDGADG